MTSIPDKPALLVVDVQVGMFTLHPPVDRGEELLAVVAQLIQRARAAGAAVIFVQHIGSESDHPLNPQTAGWPIHPSIAPGPGEPIIQKRHSDSFQQTELQRELEARNIRRLIITGIQSDYCVDTTCRRAFSLGYQVTLVADGHSTWDLGGLTAPQIVAHHNAVIGSIFGKVIPARDVQF